MDSANNSDHSADFSISFRSMLHVILTIPHLLSLMWANKFEPHVGGLWLDIDTIKYHSVSLL